MTRQLLLAAVASVAGFSVGSSAAAANFGSAVIATYRSCAAVDSSTACDGNGPGQEILWPSTSPFYGGGATGPSVLTGGDGLSASGSFVVVDGSNSANVTFETPNSEPVFSGSTDSTGNDRLGSNGVAYYTYTNTGGAPVALTLTASIAFDSSSVSPPSVGTTNGQDLPGGALYDAFVAIANPTYLNAQLSGPTSAAFGLGLSAEDAFDYDMIFGVLNQTMCGVGGVDAFGSFESATTGGSGGTSVSSSACGGGGAYEVQPGQSVTILEGYQLISNRGGEIDPFTMNFTDAPTPNALVSAPEPATWLLMLAGVGLVGGALRRRARLEKVPA